MSIIRRARSIVVLAVVAAVAAGVSYAAVPGGDGQINACYNKDNGALRVTDPQTNVPKTCTPKEASLAWSQKDAIEGYEGAPYGTIPTDGSAFELSGGVTNMPAGTYMLSGVVTWNKLGAGSANLYCYLTTPGAGSSAFAARGVASTSAGGSLPLIGEMQIAAGSTGGLSAACKEESGTAPVGGYATGHALRVDSLH